MVFDETKRKRLFKVYKTLPEDEQAAYRVLAVTYIPIGLEKICALFGEVFGKRAWSKARCEEAINRWAKAGLIEKREDNNDFGWACASLVTELAVREAFDGGEYDRLDSAAEALLKLDGEERSRRYSSITRYMRTARKVLYRGDVGGYHRLLVSLVNSAEFGEYGDYRDKNIFVRILANPLSTERILSLPLEIGKDAFYSIILPCMSDPELLDEFWAAYSEYRRRYPQDQELAEGWADYAVLAGEIEEALAVTEKLPSPDKYSLAATAAIVRGETDTALSLYETGLKLLRKAEGKRKTGYFSWTGIFYPLLLIGEITKSAQNPDAAALVKKAENYIEGTRARLGNYMTIEAFNFLEFLLPGKVKGDSFWLFEPMYTSGQPKPFNVFFFLLFAYWVDAQKAAALKPLALSTYERLATTGCGFLASELSAVISELWPDAAAKCNKTRPPKFPLKDLIRRQPDWERSLTALSGIGIKAGTAVKGAKRFAWEISWKSDKIGKTKNRRPSHISLTPLEQTVSPSGWTRGKNVALRRLYRKTESLTSMTDQDLRAAAAVSENRSSYYYGGVEYEIDVPQALEALAGHPYIFRADDGGRVEVVTSEPQLIAAMENDLYRLSISPFPDNDKTPMRVVMEDGPNCLRVTRFEERHIKMAEILGESGSLFPGGAKDTLLKTLGVLSSVVTIHSDIEGIETGAAQIEADPRVYIQLQPFGDRGEDALEASGLDVEMVVRPLGPGSVSCRPGAGGQNIFGLADAKRVQARRSLEKEKDFFMTAVRSCPVLAEAEQTAAERWRLSTPELALEFLEQAGELGDSVALEWPQGQNMRVTHRASMFSGMRSRGSGGWFELSGELNVGEDLVLSMRELMDMMAAGYGRFVPIGSGQFLALTKEFYRKLCAVSAMGEAKGDELRVSPLSVGALAPLLDGLGSFETCAEWDEARGRIEESMALTPEPPSTFKGELRNYQLEGFQWMSRLAHWGAGACLADDMGLGKTIQALALLTSRGGGGPALVVAPTSVCANWEAEAGRFAPTLNIKELRNGDREKILDGLGAFDVILTTYGLLQYEIELLSAVRWNTIVLDEAQAIKNMGTKRSMAAMKLRGDFRAVTTGTPIENHLGELWNIFRFLNPHFLGSLESFNRRFAVPIERDGDKEARLRLKRVIQPFILRRSKEQVLEELPPKTEITLKVDLKEEEQAFYEALRRSAVEELSGRDAADQRFKIFAELMRLRRACCNASLVMPDTQKTQKNAENFPSAKMEAFSEIMADLRSNGHKALVFSQFVDHLSLIRKELDGLNISYQYLDGSTPPHERARRVAAFQAGEGDCFLISLKAGGTGLNLTAADYVIHMDPWWNPAVEEQASDRAHRIGQDRPVTVYRIVAKNTIEEKIVDLHAWKRDLAESLLDESEAPARLSADEMLELIREAG